MNLVSLDTFRKLIKSHKHQSEVQLAAENFTGGV